MTTPKKAAPKKPEPTPPGISKDTVAVVAAILMTKGTPMHSAIENAKLILEISGELVNK
jgi:hypothetical protein